MTMRPYYTDPYTVDFEADVLEISRRSEHFAVVLDKSYFYPTSGGQEHDTGTINGVDVVDVIEEKGKVFHLLSEEIKAGKANSRINWQRRFENMQQHTGQHILSAAFENLFEIQTVSSRLGEEIGTIDLSRQPSDNETTAAVAEANKIVRENREVIIHFADQSTINSFKLRKPPKVEGTIRIVEVKDFDFSPCGGTHCTHTSEVGVILTGGIEKVKASLTRIEFACGDRAVKHYYALHKSAAEGARLLSTVATELPNAIEKLKQQIQESGSRMKELSERILGTVCVQYKQRLEGSAEIFDVFDLTDEVTSIEDLRYVASCLSKHTVKAFAMYKNEGASCQMNLRLPMNGADSVMEQLRTDYHAKGGGRNGFYSLSLAKNTLGEVIEKLRKILQNG
ncbi:MAG TPA: alanyl-tRNA editing protein [Candidatus Acidoferrales bacterium]|nr:alanyl-tRNA editing protein [Candidatus Acidoferrales bacterium]